MSAGNSPQREAEIRQPQLGPLGWARWAWRNLTSMRTALFLLLLLSVGAVPGSIFPQRSIDPGRVADYLAANRSRRAGARGGRDRRACQCSRVLGMMQPMSEITSRR